MKLTNRDNALVHCASQFPTIVPYTFDGAVVPIIRTKVTGSRAM